jgi:hypothetical protein
MKDETSVWIVLFSLQACFANHKIRIFRCFEIWAHSLIINGIELVLMIVRKSFIGEHKVNFQILIIDYA